MLRLESSTEMSQISSVESMWSYLKNAEKEEVAAEELDYASKYGWFSIFCNFFQSPSLPTELCQEKKTLIRLSKRSFNHEDSVHAQMLLTLYNRLTSLRCPSLIGSHWEIIGFQGTDPATDFRGVGVFGLFQPLLLAISDSTLPFLSEVLRLSHSPIQGFPFLVLSLNVSNIVLQATKDGVLDRLIREKKSALDVTTTFYGAVLYFIFEHWKLENLTLVESGPLLKKAETNCRKDVVQCIKSYDNYLESLRKSDELNPAVRLEEVQFDIVSQKSSPAIIVPKIVLNQE